MPKNEKMRVARKRYFILPAFQLRYIRFILLIMFGVGALAAWTVYYKAMILLGGKLASVYPQGRLVAIVKSVNIQILLSLLLMTPVVVLIAILLSHRIAGPIYRLEKTLAALAEGDIATRVTLRKRDELKSLADGINLVVDSLRSKISIEIDVVHRLNEIIDKMEELAIKGPVQPDLLKIELKKMRDELSDLNKSVNHYKM